MIKKRCRILAVIRPAAFHQRDGPRKRPPVAIQDFLTELRNIHRRILEVRRCHASPAKPLSRHDRRCLVAWRVLDHGKTAPDQAASVVRLILR